MPKKITAAAIPNDEIDDDKLYKDMKNIFAKIDKTYKQYKIDNKFKFEVYELLQNIVGYMPEIYNNGSYIDFRLVPQYDNSFKEFIYKIFIFYKENNNDSNEAPPIELFCFTISETNTICISSDVLMGDGFKCCNTKQELVDCLLQKLNSKVFCNLINKLKMIKNMVNFNEYIQNK